MNSEPTANSKLAYNTFSIHMHFPEEPNIPPILESDQLVECANGEIKIGKWLQANFCRIYSGSYTCPLKEQASILGRGRDDINDILTPSIRDLNILFSVYSLSEDMYVYIGKYNQNIESAIIRLSDIEHHNILVKCRRPEKKNAIANSKSFQSHSRTKERLIGSIINKVNEWRQLYKYGKVQPDHTIHRYSLEQAAQEVGVSKKSLDDYLLQLRFGREHGFDFNKYKNEKVGLLRKFVKDTKKNEQQKNKEAPGKIFDVYECKK